MVAGHLQEKQGHYYMVLSYNDASGKKRTKWKATGLPVKGNKKRAEAMLMEARQSFDPEAAEAERKVIRLMNLRHLRISRMMANCFFLIS